MIVIADTVDGNVEIDADRGTHGLSRGTRDANFTTRPIWQQVGARCMGHKFAGWTTVGKD